MSFGYHLAKEVEKFKRPERHVGADSKLGSKARHYQRPQVAQKRKN